MGAVLIALALAGLAYGLGRPRSQMLMLVGLVWLLALAGAALPGFGGLNSVLGGTAAGWLILGAAGLILAAYARLLALLRARAAGLAAPPGTEQAPAQDALLGPAELDRYARHILMREIGGPGQQRLKRAKVLVVGAGGLGSPVCLYLAAAGVGRIGVIDPDVVEASNLQRQIIHSDQRLGMPKVFSAQAAMLALNPYVEVRPYHRRLDEDCGPALVAEYDLILDGSDNFDTRYLINRLCVQAAKPLIAAAITQWEGQLSLYHPAAGGPCYECVFPNRPLPGMVPTCAEAGVAAPLPGVIGAMMAMEAVKHLTSAGEGLLGRLMIHDALYGETRVIKTRRRNDCAACANHEQMGKTDV